MARHASKTDNVGAITSSNIEVRFVEYLVAHEGAHLPRNAVVIFQIPEEPGYSHERLQITLASRAREHTQKELGKPAVLVTAIPGGFRIEEVTWAFLESLAASSTPRS